ncbi:heterokaryon incompatibility protein-domain-containing protein [Lophiotrema nucula]|uniref:Heterokaryon incompatibility protein-domain-containing protein n=1 Tax=Lophiotrema nucula TaxID=690887 RepID=A0A6A5ZKE9_9PLEO|nr:heterokaryon incompatibility protein-domain-containing protein [Lophiotrema nucula]
MASTSFRYEPLASDDCFRLLRLKDTQPGHDLYEVEIELFDARFHEAPDYEAISYAWGDESANIVISCNGRPLVITPVVASILQALRHQDSIKTLWIDAICIDQSSIAEKNVQVPRMDTIYRDAQKVWIWLGRGSYEAYIAFDFLSQMPKGTRSGDPARQEKLGGIYTLYTENVRNLRGYYDPVDTNFIFDIINLPWFHRTWTVQEVVLAKSPILLLGSKCLPWRHFVRCLEQLQDLERNEIIASQHNTLSNPASYYDEVEWYTKISHLRSFMSVPLNVLRRRLSRDPKDKIYGVYGILSNQEILRLPRVDYAKSVQEIYAETARTVIVNEQRLDVLYLTHLPPTLPDLPSWAPDWSNTGFIQPFDYTNTGPLTARRRASWTFDGPKLKVSASIVGEVRDVAVSTSNAGTDFRAGYSVTMNYGSPGEHQARLPMVCELVKTMQAWVRFDNVNRPSLETLFQKVIENIWPERYFGVTISSAMSRWIYILDAAGIDSNLPALVEEAKSRNESLLNSMKEHYMGMLGCSNHVQDWPDELVIRLLLKLDSKDVTSLQHDIALLTYQRTLLRTSNDDLGLGPRACSTGDDIALIDGLHFPFVLRKCGEHHRILGPAFIDGIENDELWDRLERKTITII